MDTINPLTDVEPAARTWTTLLGTFEVRAERLNGAVVIDETGESTVAIGATSPFVTGGGKDVLDTANASNTNPETAAANPYFLVLWRGSFTKAVFTTNDSSSRT